MNPHLEGQDIEARVLLTRADDAIVLTSANVRVFVEGGRILVTPIPLSFVDSGVQGEQTYRLRWSVLGTNSHAVAAVLANGDTLQAVELWSHSR